MSDMRRLIESLDKISEAGPIKKPGEVMGYGMGGGGAVVGGGGVPRVVPPVVWKNPRTGQTSATPPGTTVSQPLPPGVAPSTAGAGRGTTPVTQPPVSKDADTAKERLAAFDKLAKEISTGSGAKTVKKDTDPVGSYKPGGTDELGRREPGTGKINPPTPADSKKPEDIKKSGVATAVDRVMKPVGFAMDVATAGVVGTAAYLAQQPDSSTVPGSEPTPAVSTAPSVKKPAAAAPAANSTGTPAGAAADDENAEIERNLKQMGVKETTLADLQKLANVPVTRNSEPGGQIEPKFDIDKEKIVPGTKFPGYWKGRDSAAKSRERMVGDESIIPSLAKQAKEKTLEWQIEEAYQKFKEQEYTGIDPIVRQRMGMQPATQDQIRSYLDKNPPGIKTGDGAAVISGSGAPIQSGGLVNVARAADAASPDRALSVAKPPTAAPAAVSTPAAAPAPAPAPAPAAAAPAAPAATSVATSIPPVSTPVKPAAVPAAAAPVPYKGSAGSQEIQKLNPVIKDVNKIRPGQTFKMPDGSNYTVKPGDTLDKIARGSNKPNQLSVPGQPYKQLTTDPTAGEAKDKAAQADADRIDPGAPGFVPPSKTAPPIKPTPPVPNKSSDAKRLGVPEKNIGPSVTDKISPAAPATKPGVATPGPTPRKTYDRLTPPQKQAVDTINKAAPQKNEAINKLAEQFAAFMEAQDEYGPEYQAMVKRVGDRARQGAMKTVWDPVKRVYKNVPVKQTKSVKEYQNAQDQDSQVTSPPAPDATAASQTFVQDKELQNMNAQKTLEADAGAQDPNKQTTSPPSPAAVAQPAAPAAPSAPDVSVATAKTTMAGLKSALGPGVDTNAAATGVAKANLGQPLNPAEQQAVGALTPLVMKAATIPSAAPQLRSALTNAGTMTRAAAAQQGKM